MTDKRYTADELRAMPTLSVGQADDLKVDDGKGTRVWLSRLTVADGVAYDDGVTVEKYRGGKWETVEEYPGNRPDLNRA